MLYPIELLGRAGRILATRCEFVIRGQLPTYDTEPALQIAMKELQNRASCIESSANNLTK